jgi:DNA-binding XRE family transcriptional regulator
MNKRTTWDEMRAGRADSSERRRGYDSAGRAIRLAFEIRTLREKKGLSQRQLAELVGTTQSAIARLEGGRISPSLPTLDRIAAALGAEVTVTITDTAELAIWVARERHRTGGR